MAAALATNTVVVPYCQGERGHPVGFGAACRDALLTLDGPQGAARVVRDQEALQAVFRLDLDDVGIVTDIDTLQDLTRAERLLAGG